MSQIVYCKCFKQGCPSKHFSTEMIDMINARRGYDSNEKPQPHVPVYEFLTEYCQEESTRLYSFGNKEWDKCGKKLPCSDHTRPIDTMRSYTIPDAMQPAPVANDLPAVWGLVMKDMVDRDQLGRKRYGVPLQPHNGRDALKDAYEEALDLVVYLRQAIYERDNPRAS